MIGSASSSAKLAYLAVYFSYFYIELNKANFFISIVLLVTIN